MSNLIITIGRQFGSGGKEIGKKLAAEVDAEHAVSLKKYGMMPRNSCFHFDLL